MEMFKDVSPLQGWRQFLTPSGEMKVELKGGGEVAYFLRSQDAFIHQFSIRINTVSKKPTNEKLYDIYIEHLD